VCAYEKGLAILSMKDPLHIILVKYLASHPGQWIHGGDIERVAQENGQEGETAKRRMREKTRFGERIYDPTIEEGYENGAILYRYNPEKGLPIVEAKKTEVIVNQSAENLLAGRASSNDIAFLCQ